MRREDFVGPCEGRKERNGYVNLQKAKINVVSSSLKPTACQLNQQLLAWMNDIMKFD